MAMIPQMSAPSYQQQTQSMNANPAYQQWQQQQAAKRASMPTTAVPPQFGTPATLGTGTMSAPMPMSGSPAPAPQAPAGQPMPTNTYQGAQAQVLNPATKPLAPTSPAPSGTAAARPLAPKMGGRTAQAQSRSGRTAITPSEQFSAYQRATKSMS